MSSAKHFTEVLIGGKVYTLSGFEGEEYLQKVSSYLNHKITECTNSEGYRKQSADTRNVLLALNIADDYFKAKKQGDSRFYRNLPILIYNYSELLISLFYKSFKLLLS